jgi:hypothetical protein
MTLKPVDTAIVMIVGPLVDDTDFKSLEESITYNAAGMDISLIIEKTDGTSTTTAITLTTGGTSDWTHKDGGYYEVEITSVQNAEEGIAYVRGICTGVLPFESPRYEIVKANIYDSFIKGTDILQTDLTQIGGVVQSLTDFKDLVDTGYDPINHKIQSDLIYIHGTALTETDGQLATAFKKLFDVTTPLLVASDVMRGTDSANTTTPPTVGAIRTEMEGVGTKLLAIEGDTHELQTNQGAWATATGFSTHSAANVWAVAARVLTANTNFNDLDAIAIRAEAVGALADIKLDHLLNIAVDTDWGTTVHLDSVIGHMADVGTAATFNRTTDALEALRNRGDAAWIAATGFSTHSAADVKTAIEQAGSSIAQIIADTGELQTDWVNGGRLDNLLDAIPTTAMRGTDSAYTGIPPTVIQIRTEMDTNSTKMAPSQTLADYKATGFSTHNAAAIWSVGTRALTDKSEFGLSTASINLIWDDLISGMVAAGSIGKLIADNLNASITSRSPVNEYDTEMGYIPSNLGDVPIASELNSAHGSSSWATATGFNTVIPDVVGTAATLHGITDGKIDVIDAIVDTIKAKTDNLPSGIAKNVALPKFDFLMVLSSDHVTAAIGKTVTGEISKNGNTFTGITNTITEVSGGMYTIADGFTQTEMNADIITLQFSEDTCDTRTITLVTN